MAESIEVQEAVEAAMGRLVDEDQDTRVAIQELHRFADPQDIASAYIELATNLYWQKKDLSAFISVSQIGISYCLSVAALHSKAKGLAYNLGAFCWPGWEEMWVTIDATALYIGRDAARLNLRLAKELSKGDLPLSRAHWLMGAQAMAAEDWASAAGSFEEARLFAQKAEAEGEELLAKGFALLTAQLAGDDSVSLEEVRQELASLEYIGFIGQIDAAARVFRK